MAAPEQVPNPENHGDPTPNQLLVGIADPLELAAQALAKLKAYGLSGYIDKLPTEPVTGIQDSQVLLSGDVEAKPSGKVIDLDEYRHSKDVPVPQPVVRKPRSFDRPATPQPRLSPERQVALIEQVQSGDEAAMQRICEDILPFVKMLANTLNTSALSFDERVAVGLEGARQAAKRFDASQGAKWSTFAAHRIIGAMHDEERVALPVARSVHSRLKEISDIEDPEERQRLLHEWATHKNQHERLEIAPQLMDEEGYINLSLPSFDAVIYDDSANPFHGLVAEASDNVEQAVLQKEEMERIKAFVKQLPEQQRVILGLYYDALAEESTDLMTLKAIGEHLGITESRVSQIQTRGTENLRRLIDGEEILGPSRGNRLSVLNTRREAESKFRFLERTYEEIEQYGTKELSAEEITTIEEALPEGWTCQRIRLDRGTYDILKLPLAERIDLDTTLYGSERRAVGWKGSTLTILVDSLTVDDLGALMDLHRRLGLHDSGEFPVHEDLMSRLSDRELQVFKDFYMPYGQLALKLGLSISTIRTHAHNMMSELGTDSSAHLAVIGALGGLVDLEQVPEGRTRRLSNRQTELLHDYYALTYKEGMRRMNVSISTYRRHWHNIFKKTGALTQPQAVLMAVKDGLITDANLPVSDKE